MNPARIAELLEPFIRARPSSVAQSKFDCHSEPAKAGEEAAGLSPTQLQHISIYIDILIRWNARINLTAIRDPEEIVIRHFGESLFAARHLFPDVSAAPFKEQAPPPIESRQESVAGAANHQPPRSYDRLS